MSKKRILTLIMTFVMLCTSFSISYAEGTDTTEITPLSSTAYQALRAMGFVGEELEGIDENANITRGQFAAYLCKLAGYNPGDRTTEDIPFIDVSIDTPYYNEICTMYERGIISGMSSNQFSPDTGVTFAQAVKMIIHVLGYMGYTELRYGEYPMGPIRAADELDIIDGVENVAWNSALSAEDAMTLLYNAGTTYVIDPKSINENDGGHFIRSNETLFQAGNDIFYGEGIMESNGVASINSKGIVDERIIIGGNTIAAPDADVKDLLGCRVEYFYVNSELERKALWVQLDDTDTEVVEISAKDLAVDDSDHKVRNIVYYKDKKRKDSLKVSDYAPVVYNNDLVLLPSQKHVTPITGTIRLIDNNDDNVYDVMIIEEYYNVFVKYYSPNDDLVTDTYGRVVNFKDFNYICVEKDGVEIDRSTISPSSILSCVVNEDKTKIYAYAVEKNAKGIVAGIKDDDYTFEEGTYTLSPDYAIDTGYYKFKPEIGEGCTYYLDIAGDIGAFVEGDGALQYALIMKIYADDVNYDGIVYTRLLLEDGSKVTGETNRKISIGKGNDVSRRPAVDLMDIGKNEFGLYDGGVLVPQVVQVAFNTEGKLNEIRFAIDNTNRSEKDGKEWDYYDLDNFSKDYTKSSAYVRTDGGYLADNTYMIDSGTIVFANWKNSADTEPYGVYTRTTISTGNRNLTLYDVGQDLIPKAIYMKDYLDEKAYWMGDGYMFVEERDVIYEDGMELDRLTGILNGARQTVTESEPGIISDEIGRGYVVRLSNRNSHVTFAEVLLTKEELVSKTPKLISTGNPDAVRHTRYVQLYNVNPNGLVTVNHDDWVGTYGKLNSAGYRSSTAMNVTIYDISDDSTTIGNIHDIYQLYAPMANRKLPSEPSGSMVLITTRYTAIQDIIFVVD